MLQLGIIHAVDFRLRLVFHVLLFEQSPTVSVEDTLEVFDRGLRVGGHPPPGHFLGNDRDLIDELGSFHVVCLT